jgi:KDO2-lipid IV(A) lauroyltransferase
MAILLNPAKGIVSAAFFTLLRVLPVRMASDCMAFFTGKLARHIIREKVVRRNLITAFPDLDQSTLDTITKNIAESFGRCTAEIAHIPTYATGKQGTKISASGSLDYTFEQLGQGIFVTAHLGSWELTPILLRRNSRPLIIYSKIGEPMIDNKLMSLRQKAGANYVEKSEALKACIKTMKAGESIGLLVDQRVSRGVDVTFFGRPTLFTDLPARLALKFNRPIIPIEGVREAPGHCKVIIHPPIWPGEKRDKQAVGELTQQMATVIEDCIRKRPGEWHCNKNRWKTADRVGWNFEPQAALDKILEAATT